MVDVRVGKQYKIHLSRRKRETQRQLNVMPLRQPAVNEYLAAANFKVMAAPRDLARRPKK
jgi:hypothetical protein